MKESVGIVDNVKMRVAENLKTYREAKGVTQKQLADHLGVRDNTISSWESGTNSIDISVLLKICDFLGIELNDIYGIGENKKSSALLLSEDEEALIKFFRLLSRDDKMKVLGMVEIKATEK